MAKCPECGGEMISRMKRKVCQTCGLSLTIAEYDQMWDKIRDAQRDSERASNNRKREYLKWYQSSKK